MKFDHIDEPLKHDCEDIQKNCDAKAKSSVTAMPIIPITELHLPTERNYSVLAWLSCERRPGLLFVEFLGHSFNAPPCCESKKLFRWTVNV